MELQKLFERDYEKIRIEGFDFRYLPFTQLKNYLELHFLDLQCIGKSFLGNEIFHLKLGNGPIQVLAWSQMHGNETTGTRAMLDVWAFLQSNNDWTREVLSKVTFHFIPMLNPDGATKYARRNAIGIDLNRDFNKESSPEIKILKSFVLRNKFNYLFNLHDQRTIFNVGKSKEPATLSFLAPSANADRDLTDSRSKSMSVIYHIYNKLQPYLKGNMARFSDEFYPNSTGDNFIKMGIPTILFEAGHYHNDYQRNYVRKYNAFAILLALDAIINQNQYSAEQYLQIPPNNQKLLDIVLRNVKIQFEDKFSLVDLGIQYEEFLNHQTQKIEFIAKIYEIGDLSSFYGHFNADLNGCLYTSKSSIFPQIGSIADFSVNNLEFEKGIFMN